MKRNVCIILSMMFLFAFMACNDDEFGVERENVEMHVGEELMLQILHASGECTVQVENPDLLQATVSDGCLKLYATDEGSTVVYLTDAGGERRNVQVHSSLDLTGWWSPVDKGEYFISVWLEDWQYKEKIESELYKQQLSPFTSEYYRFMSPDKADTVSGLMSPDETDAVSRLLPMPPFDCARYEFKNGLLYVTLEEDEPMCFDIWKWTENELWLREDLTEHYRELYPEAGVIEVRRSVKFKKYQR